MNAPERVGTPFHAQASAESLADLRQRLERTRLPREQAGIDWETGTPLSYAERLRDYWLNEFDWRRWEARINAYPQRMVEIDGQQIHVIIESGSGEQPLPLVMTNGWPGSFLEFIDLIDQLAHPEKHGGRIEDAFTVVIPSLPGYGFSPPPGAPISPAEIARLWWKLMTQTLGCDRYVAYGSDWGSLVTALLALDYPERLDGILLTSPGFVPTITEAAPLTKEEASWQQRADRAMRSESGYQMVQGTKPQSLAYGHTDSPIGLASWVIEKFHAWTIPGSHEDPPFRMDELLANVMLYWLNGAVAPMWLYFFLQDVTTIAPGRKATVPAGFLFAPGDLVVPPPRSWLERSFNVALYRVMDSGGHFPGMDNAEQLVPELRAFFGRTARQLE